MLVGKLKGGITMSKVKVVLNEQHKLMKNQVEVLDENFGEGNWELFNVPASGWTLSEMTGVAKSLEEAKIVVFASPIPALMVMLSEKRVKFSAFHNDNRVKKELPDGRIITVVAQDGWVIV